MTYLRTLISTAVAGLMLTSTPALPMDVTMTTLKGDMVVSGTYLRHENGYYVIETAIGEMRMAADMVICEGAGCPEGVLAEDIKIVGSQILTQRLMPVLLEGYSDYVAGGFEMLSGDDKTNRYSLTSLEDGAEGLQLTTSGTDAAFEALLAQDASFAVTTRPAADFEQKTAQQLGIEQLRGLGHEHVIGYDGLLLVTNPANQMRAISEVVAAQIFAGEITNWSQLGGEDAAINVYIREAGSGARDVFDEMMMRSNRKRMSDGFTELTSDEAVAAAIKSDRHAFGFTSMVYADDRLKPLEITGVCGMPTPANEFTIQTGEYPLTRALYLYSADDTLTGHAKSFLDYVTSDAGQAKVVEAGFVGQSISSMLLNGQGNRLASALLVGSEEGQRNDMEPIRNMVSMLMASERLSTTVRFTQGGSTLDAAAIADVARLGEMLSGPDYADKQFFFMGFSDSVGREDLNQLLALQRAELVRQTLLEQYPELSDRINVRSVGFGEISPLGCNETRTGRSINRRVEIWMQDVIASKV